jgi:asparagine synthase (glutamine-hydrolysing)
MMDLLVHRGPDDAGTYSNSEGTIGHRRLAIMDPSGGRQPIKRHDSTCAIAANGEIYNFPQLRAELASRHEFLTASDSESALHLYHDAGIDVASQLSGMFAFAIADGKNLYVARDPVGIKPLYYGQRGQTLVFASELKAIVDYAVEVREFPPGTWFHSRHGFHRYYDVPNDSPTHDSLSAHLQRVRSGLEEAVAKRLMSDVPVGAFLSGGLDSSLIAALARPHVDELHTFSVGIEGSRDIEAAQLVARHLDTVHHEYLFTPDEVLAVLPDVIYHLESFDQDLVRSAVPCYLVSRLASQFVKVILTGEGADELFAGYDYYRELDCPQQLHRELRRSVCSLHNINLQRVDRLTMAHSIEGRVPFLDVALIQVAQAIPPGLKLFADDRGNVVEKWILRKAFEDLLPSEIIWRDKEQFDEGSGATDFLSDIVSRWMTTSEARRYANSCRSSRLRSHEESVYHKLLVEAFPNPDGVLRNVARWIERPGLNSVIQN